MNTAILRPEAPSLPVTFLRPAPDSGELEAVAFDGSSFGASERVGWLGENDTAGAVWLAGSLYYGTNTGEIFQRPVVAGSGAQEPRSICIA